jgi:hypothetical protein
MEDLTWLEGTTVQAVARSGEAPACYHNTRVLTAPGSGAGVARTAEFLLTQTEPAEKIVV